MKTSWKELRYSYLTGFLFLQDQHKQMQNKTRRNHIFLVKYKKYLNEKQIGSSRLSFAKSEYMNQSM